MRLHASIALLLVGLFVVAATADAACDVVCGIPPSRGAGLYPRLHGKADVLRSGTRDRLVEVIRRRPGVTVSDAAEEMGLARNAVLHHVHVLQRVRVVRIEDRGRRRELYLVGERFNGVPAWILKNPACATLARAIQESPEGLPRAAARALLTDLPERTRTYNIQKLLGCGFVEQVVAPDGAKVLRIATDPRRAGAS